MTRYFLIFQFLALAIVGQAQNVAQNTATENPKKTEIDLSVQKAALTFMGNALRVGLSVGVYKNGKRFTYNFGTTQKGIQQLPTGRSVYEIGSITKTFTGTLLAQAVKDRKVKIDDDIRKDIDGEYPNLEYGGQPIRLFQLINHVSGLPLFLPDDPNLFVNPDFDKLPFVITATQQSYTKQSFFNDLHGVKLNAEPGTNFQYSNAGAQLLKYILERVYGISYERLLEKYITKANRMKSTHSVFSKNNSGFLVKGYNDKGKVMPYNPQMLEAAGGIFSNVLDMLRYLRFHLDESNEIVALSHKVTRGNINEYAVGLNWQERLTPEKDRKIWQSGGTFGFASYCVIYPDLNIGIVLLSNESDPTAQGGLEEMAGKIFAGIKGGDKKPAR